MAYSTPRTWAAGERPTAAQFNQDIRDNQLAAFPLGVDAWTPYTPALTGTGSNPTLGTGGATTGRYQRVGRTIYGWARATFGSAGTAAGSGNYLLSLPVPTVAAIRNFAPIGHGWVGGTDSRLVVAIPDSVGDKLFMIFEGGEIVTSAAPWAWTTAYMMAVSFQYEAAS